MADIGERRTANYTTSENLKRRIEVGKSDVKEKYLICKTSAKKLVSAHEALVVAEEKQEMDGSRKAHSKCMVLEHKYNVAKENYLANLERYEESIAEMDMLYDELIAMESAKDSKKTSREADKFDSMQAVLKGRLATMVNVTGDSFERDESEEEPSQPIKNENPQNQEAVQKAYQETTPYMHGAVGGVSIAPMSIDISHIVEEAVAVAMEKFKAAFIKEADAFTESLPKEEKVVAVSKDNASSATAENLLVMENAVLDEEKNIAERLRELSQNLAELQEQITELGAAYIDVSAKQKEAAEAQRKINDMQRTLAREIQGVQANQKVINQEHSEIYADQTLVIEQQKANLEAQKTLIESQNGIAEMQKTTIEAQAALEESISEVLRSHKEMIAAQQSIINQSAKNASAQEELTKKQNEVTAMQKEAMSKHKQLARAQKNASAKTE